MQESYYLIGFITLKQPVLFFKNCIIQSIKNNYTKKHW